MKDGSKVTKGELIYEWDPYNAVIISEHSGVINVPRLKRGCHIPVRNRTTDGPHSKGCY